MTQATPSFSLFSTKNLKRDDLVHLVKIALYNNEPHYARMAALAWLTSFPGDLPVTILHARAMLAEGLVRQALPVLDNLCQTDPECLEAFELLTEARQKTGLASALEAEAHVIALGGSSRNPAVQPKWAALVRSSRQKMSPSGAIGNSTAADSVLAKSIEANPAVPEGQSTDEIHQALAENPSGPLAAVTHLLHMYRNHPIPAAVQQLANVYHQRWPRCLQFSLILADCWMDGGASEKAVALLHQAASQDVSAEIPRRIWPEGNPYAEIWPTSLEIPSTSPSAPQRIPIPAAVAAVMGWNQLNTGGGDAASTPVTAPAEEEAKPENTSQEAAEIEQSQSVLQPAPNYENGEQKSIREALNHSAAKIQKPELARLDGRYPQYVVLASRSGLEKIYGVEGADQIDAAVRQVLPAVSGRKSWGALVFYVDAPQLSSNPAVRRMTPAIPGDPWSIKLSLADLDKILAEQGEMVGAVLIVGGPEVIPFHRLPNPIDDDDTEVLSDNPYASRDENYFIPEWPVGRLPGGAGCDPAFLVHQLQMITNYHIQQSTPLPWPKKIWTEMRNWLTDMGFPLPRALSSMGFSAAIWRRASLSVFRTIGDPKNLQVSPPNVASAPIGLQETQEALPGGSSNIDLNARLGYFNLHGLADANEWYGQRDPNEPGEAPEFPMAFRPEDIPVNGTTGAKTHQKKKGKVPQIVFSEACYGANISNRQVSEAISLRFLQAGSLAVAGSTCISYGSISAPLIAADLLGRTFWRFLNEGCVAGEAMRRAKISLAKEMHRRQGYLDGEDQKTLISFVLYGDPLAQVGSTGRGPKATLRATLPQPIQTVCDRTPNSQESSDVPDQVIAQVKTIVSEYLPGMNGAKLSYTQERAGCHSPGHKCPSAQLGPKTIPQLKPERQVVVLSKQIKNDKVTHHQFARLTLDAQGKLVKLVVSR